VSDCPTCAKRGSAARVLLEAFVRILKEAIAALDRYLAATKSG
jgi:hypothetical protein